jgi:hypothetical protein
LRYVMGFLLFNIVPSWSWTMPARLSQRMAYCLERAGMYGEKARAAPDLSVDQRDFSELEAQWLSLARGYKEQTSTSNLERSLGNEPKHFRQAQSDSAPRRFQSTFKGVASGRTGMRGGPRLFNQLADDRHRARPAPGLARLAWLERPDPDSAHED